jgi:hypothetical protein
MDYQNAPGVGGTLGEHSTISKATKVIPGPVSIKRHATLVHRSALAISQSVGTDLALERGKLYRVVSTADCNIALYDSGAAIAVSAVTADMYLPAKTPVVIETREWDRIASVGSGTIQAIEVL